jgi:hypothetical protein
MLMPTRRPRIGCVQPSSRPRVRVWIGNFGAEIEITTHADARPHPRSPVAGGPGFGHSALASSNPGRQKDRAREQGHEARETSCVQNWRVRFFRVDGEDHAGQEEKDGRPRNDPDIHERRTRIDL